MTTKAKDYTEVFVTTVFTRNPAQVADQADLMKAIQRNHTRLQQLYHEIEEHELLWSTETRRQKHKEMRKLNDEMQDQFLLARNYY